MKEECTICLESISNPVVTSCGHTFCGDCILEYCEHTTPHQIAQCPLCRRNITMFIVVYSSHSSDLGLSPSSKQKIEDYNRRFSSQRSGFISRTREDYVLLRHSMTNTRSRIKFILRTFALMIFFSFFFYVLLPTDLIADFIPFLGFLDDLSLALALFSLFIFAAEKYRDYLLTSNHNTNYNPNPNIHTATTTTNNNNNNNENENENENENNDDEPSSPPPSAPFL